jgi:hypothetical protein
LYIINRENSITEIPMIKKKTGGVKNLGFLEVPAGEI